MIAKSPCAYASGTETTHRGLSNCELTQVWLATTVIAPHAILGCRLGATAHRASVAWLAARRGFEWTHDYSYRDHSVQTDDEVAIVDLPMRACRRAAAVP